MYSKEYIELSPSVLLSANALRPEAFCSRAIGGGETRGVCLKHDDTLPRGEHGGPTGAFTFTPNLFLMLKFLQLNMKWRQRWREVKKSFHVWFLVPRILPDQ